MNVFQNSLKIHDFRILKYQCRSHLVISHAIHIFITYCSELIIMLFEWPQMTHCGRALGRYVSWFSC